jgi:hypothetical protein
MSERPRPDSHQLHDANTGLGMRANKQTTETTDPTFCPELTPTTVRSVPFSLSQIIVRELWIANAVDPAAMGH